MRNFIILLLFIPIYYSQVNAQNANKPDQTKQAIAESKALARINALYEVKDFMADHKKSKPIAILDGDPDTV